MSHGRGLFWNDGGIVLIDTLRSIWDRSKNAALRSNVVYRRPSICSDPPLSSDHPMSLVLVVDSTDSPAQFGVAAARIARRLGACFMHGGATFDLARDADAAQYVFAGGGLGPSGLFFVERILAGAVQATASIEAILASARKTEVVVPVHPRFGQDVDDLVRSADRAGVAWRRIDCHDAAAEPVGGRTALPGPPLRIALLGRKHDHCRVYPAALTSLADAASQTGIAVDIRFVDPLDLVEEGSSEIGEADGILLPGGSDMANVPGQMAAASFAIRRRVPVLGLCLGMQTMATAFAEAVAGVVGVALAEADADTPDKSFVPMAEAGEADMPPLPVHRTGDGEVRLRPGTQLARLMAAATMTIRCNHRYRLSPGLRPRLERAGLVVCGESHGGRIADAVEWPEHPFFLGLQGHPELGAPEAAPHPVFRAFLEAARQRS
ncbi:glutamine amidotransferase-related protein [Jiella sonneratiae]|uniref:CTP synthase (glutamine hydrolyzing) n=1 Tax=Jiella sonneratiae TaxID=2816856 RepID=A0ABS3J8C3_9HYPH|nr:gamma-glutamyl-gamma-aminobutyrate hydrolase family protein [Jiella sonneratiae]MBO0904826.1 gamma-glutamyl-gamma-aminobutyrate hydrolase family protein [Jiella sonneratiae]